MYSMYSSFKRKSDSQSCPRNQPLQLMSSQISSTQYCCCQHSQQTLPTARSTENRAITSDKPALSDSAKEAKRVRRRRQRRWKAKGNENDYVAYHIACRAANKEIINARCNFYKKQIAEEAENPRRRWSVIRSILHLAKSKTFQSPEECQNLTDTFSSFFIDTIRKTKELIKARSVALT